MSVRAAIQLGFMSRGDPIDSDGPDAGRPGATLGTPSPSPASPGAVPEGTARHCGNCRPRSARASMIGISPAEDHNMIRLPTGDRMAWVFSPTEEFMTHLAARRSQPLSLSASQPLDSLGSRAWRR
jgi:hypothetical protein